MYALPAAAISIGSYVAAPLLLSRCRPQGRPLITPLNWLFVLFALQLVVTPVVVILYGPYVELLPHTPSTLAVNLGVLLYTLGYWSFCAGVHLFRRPGPTLASSVVHCPGETWNPPLWMIALYAILGVVGVLAFFGNVGKLLLYFLNPQEYLATLEEGAGITSVGDAASTFLRAFFPFCILLCWCRVTLLRGRFSYVASGLLLGLFALSSPIYSYERSSLVVPLLSVGAVFTKRKSQAATWAVFGLVAAMTLMVAGITAIRLDPKLPGAQSGPSAQEIYQGYAMAPQYLGFLLEGTGYGRDPSLGTATVGSILTPVPVLGKPFRESSGLERYFRLTQRTDLPSPFIGELLLDGGIPMVVMGFLALGWGAARLQDAFAMAREPLHVYVLQFSTIWFSYLLVSSASTVSLAAIYLSWPIYCFFIYRALVPRLRVGRSSGPSKRNVTYGQAAQT